MRKDGLIGSPYGSSPLTQLAQYKPSPSSRAKTLKRYSSWSVSPSLTDTSLKEVGRGGHAQEVQRGTFLDFVPPTLTMVADKGKKVKVSAEDENSDQLDGEIIHSIEKLQEVQDELEKINEEASEKVLEVEQKYNEVRRPIYEKRGEIIKSIPDFWFSAFLSHPALASLLTDEDHKIFKFFSSLEVEECKDVKSGYSITFNFRPNPYFEDTKLTKTYTYLDEGITNVTATEIKWKEGMGIQNGVTRKKGKKRSLEEESFFNWFSSSKQDDATAEIQDEVAEIIKEDFWPRPLTFFNNDPDDEEDGDEDDDDDDEEERNGDGSDDDEDDDDEEEEEDEDNDEGEGDN